MRESNSRVGLPLSATFVKQVNHPGVYGDGRGGYGLTLRVRRMTNGRLSRVWVQRLRINGRATNLGLGSFPVVGLATARERALDNRRKIEQGIDPRITENPTPTVADALEAVIEGRSASWKNGGRSAEILAQQRPQPRRQPNPPPRGPDRYRRRAADHRPAVDRPL